MSLKKSWATVFLLIVLEIGALGSVPLAPRQIEELMETMNQTKTQHVIRDENDEGKD